MTTPASALVVLNDDLDDDMKLAVLEYIDVIDSQIMGNEDLLDALLGVGEYSADILKGILKDEELAEAKADPEQVSEVKRNMEVLEDIRYRMCRQFGVQRVTVH